MEGGKKFCLSLLPGKNKQVGGRSGIRRSHWRKNNEFSATNWGGGGKKRLQSMGLCGGGNNQKKRESKGLVQGGGGNKGDCSRGGEGGKAQNERPPSPGCKAISVESVSMVGFKGRTKERCGPWGIGGQKRKQARPLRESKRKTLI